MGTGLLRRLADAATRAERAGDVVAADRIELAMRRVAQQDVQNQMNVQQQQQQAQMQQQQAQNQQVAFQNQQAQQNATKAALKQQQDVARQQAEAARQQAAAQLQALQSKMTQPAAAGQATQTSMYNITPPGAAPFQG